MIFKKVSMNFWFLGDRNNNFAIYSHQDTSVLSYW